MTLSAAQQREIAKYERAYRRPRYHMKGQRQAASCMALEGVPWRESYLDVSCGRGEMLDYARRLGFARVHGTEVVQQLLGPDVVYALAWQLPFGDDAVQVVSMFDVIEHLLPGDDEKACRELARVARRCILITANNLSSMHGSVELHVNRRPYEEWDRLFRQWFAPAEVTWRRELKAKDSEFWRIDL